MDKDPDLVVRLKLTIAECVVITDMIAAVERVLSGKKMDIDGWMETLHVANAINIAGTRQRIFESMDQAEAIAAATKRK